MDIPVITKEQAIASYDGNASALARALGITPSAIYQWPEGPISEGYALKLRYVLRPAVFAQEPESRDRRPAALEGSDAAETDGVEAGSLSEAA